MADTPDRRPSACQISRRGMFSLAGAAGAALAAGPLRAAEPHGLLGDQPYVTPRDGTIRWSVLARVEGRGWGEPAVFDESVVALDGQEVAIDGFMLPYDDEPRQKRFLLMSFRAHCPYCLPGGMASMIDVHVDDPVAVTEGVVTVTGKLSVHQGRDEYEILYSMNDGLGGPLAG